MAFSSNLTVLFLLVLLTACGESGGQAPFHFGVSPEAKKIFVTTTTFSGNLGGIAGADASCMGDPSYPGTGTYKAFLSDGNDRIACDVSDCTDQAHTDWVLTPDTEYVLTNGSYIGQTNQNGIFVFPLVNAFAGALGGHYLFTGLETDYTSSGNNCLSWTAAVNSGVALAQAGAFGATSDAAISSDLVSCDNSSAGEHYHLLCVEQ